MSSYDLVDSDYDKYPVRVAVVSTDGGYSRDLYCTHVPPAQELNFICIMAEHVGRYVYADELCHRLKVSLDCARVYACRLRREVRPDWLLDSCYVDGHGFRLCYVGGPLLEARRTYPKFLVYPTHWRRRHLVRSYATRPHLYDVVGAELGGDVP